MLSLADEVGFALIIDKRSQENYFASTLLTFEQAYKNARLVAKPAEWLSIA